MLEKMTMILIGVSVLVIAQSGIAGDVKLRGKPSNTDFSGRDASQKSTIEKSFSDNDAIYEIIAGGRYR